MILDGENQTSTAAQEFLLVGVQLMLQHLLRGAADPSAICAPAQMCICTPGRLFGCDGSVTKSEGEVTIVTEKVRVLIIQLLVVLKTHSGTNREGWRTWE